MAAYVISEVELLDEANFQRYRELASASIARYGGRYLVRGAEPEVPEGTWPASQGVVVIEFPTMEALQRWYRSADYAEALTPRRTALKRRLLFVEGVGDQPSTLAPPPPASVGQLTRALCAVGQLITGIRDEQWLAPTPCTDWTVCTLVNHLVSVNLIVAALLGDQTLPPRGPTTSERTRPARTTNPRPRWKPRSISLASSNGPTRSFRCCHRSRAATRAHR